MANEHSDECTRAMGVRLGTAFNQLQEEVDWLSHKWNEFRVLFENGPARIDLLNRVASTFFYLLKKLMFEDAMLHLCRLSDPARQGTFENLSLMRLPGLIDDKELLAKVHEHLDKIQERCEFARRWRDKVLAHADLQRSRDIHASPLPKVASEDIKEAIGSMRLLLNCIAEHYGRPPVGFLGDPFGAASLVHYLGEAVRAEEVEKQRWRKLANVDPGAS